MAINKLSKVMSALFISGTVLVTAANAGFYGITTHSRANCGGINESVTWWAGHSFWWRVESHHYHRLSPSPEHILNTGMNYTWRSVVYHSHESYRDRVWFVKGYHFSEYNGRELLDVVTEATNCGIYDGWWDI